ncbi:MAG TPA: AmmeMemoRadiSam system protein A [Vicinamibacterales bacterium]|nr:AmmeMemoRadiSam system protein A [Vicinamibacterales bacterium]
MLTDSQKHALIDVARRALTAQVTGGTPPLASSVTELPDASGVFVTIKERGELRGCLGTLEATGLLAEQVARCAADAASEDPRFSPVTVSELSDLSVEVSVLGPLERIDPTDPDAITIGRHGLVAEQGSRRGLLLPQVATEWGWTIEQFLQQTCLKAGLRRDAWQHGAGISRFDAEVFGE